MTMLAVRGDGPAARSVSDPARAGCPAHFPLPFVCPPSVAPTTCLFSTVRRHLRYTPTPEALFLMRTATRGPPHNVAVKAAHS